VDQDALARRHMQQQVKDVARLQIILGALWDRTLDPSDIDGSFTRFQAQASALIKAGRRSGELTAQEYYDAAKVLAGYDAPAPDVEFQPTETKANRAALHATSVANAKAAIAKGTPPDAALEAAKAAMLRAAKRRVLEAPRRRLIRLANEDGDARGWARVSDGRPCHFCAMLLSRGPVYSSGTAHFEAHDGCGCSAKPVFKNDQTGGWDPGSRRLNDLYKASTAKYGGFWRTDYAYALAHPELSLDELQAHFTASHEAYFAARKTA